MDGGVDFVERLKTKKKDKVNEAAISL